MTQANTPEQLPEDPPEFEDDGIAHSQIYLGQRLMLLCHKHALALIDLADGNGVKLRIEPLEIEDFGQFVYFHLHVQPASSQKSQPLAL